MHNTRKFAQRDSTEFCHAIQRQERERERERKTNDLNSSAMGHGCVNITMYPLTVSFGTIQTRSSLHTHRNYKLDLVPWDLFHFPKIKFNLKGSILTRPSVIYWPSTEPSIKRCTCVNKRRNSGSRWMSNNYITRCHRRLESVPVGVGVSWGARCQRENQLANWGLAALSDPQLSNPSQDEEEVLLSSEELWVNM